MRDPFTRSLEGRRRLIPDGPWLALGVAVVAVGVVMAERPSRAVALLPIVVGIGFGALGVWVVRHPGQYLRWMLWLRYPGAPPVSSVRPYQRRDARTFMSVAHGLGLLFFAALLVGGGIALVVAP